MESLPLILQLIVREQWRGQSLRVEPDAVVPGIPPDEVPFVAVAAALGAGEPKRAVGILDALDAHDAPDDGDRAAVRRVLRRFAMMLEHNWFPGGACAVLEPGQGGQFGVPVLPAESGRVGLYVDVMDFFSILPFLRAMATSSRRGFDEPGQSPIAEAESLLRRLLDAEEQAAAAAVALATADLHVQAGLVDQAMAPLNTALQLFTELQDAVGVASGALAKGDWFALPLSHPELLGETPDWPLAESPVRPPDPALAAAQYAEELARCRRLAAETGDGALAALALVHDALNRVDEGSPVSMDAVADEVGRWSTSVGSRSFVRGLGRLCVARAQRLRDATPRARRVLLLAEALNDRVEAVTEPALVRRELAEQYGSVNYRRAAFVLAHLDLEELGHAEAPTMPEWARRADLAISLSDDGIALKDPDALDQTLQHLTRCAGVEPADGDPEQISFLRKLLTHQVNTSTVLADLYRGVKAGERGHDESAATRFEAALALSESLGPGMNPLRVIVLGTMRRTAEARELAESMIAAGDLPPGQAASLLTRLKAYDQAERQLALHERQDPGPAPQDPPWEPLALRAEILLGTHRAAQAVPIAEQAIAAFEEHLASLSRDVLRTMASDSPTVAGLYTTAVRAHSALAAQGADGHVEAGFTLSDRSRGIVLTDLIELDKDAGDDDGAVAAARAWLRAGAALARTIEGVDRKRSPVAAADVRQRIRDAERDLDDAEEALTTVAPAILTRRRSIPLTRSLAQTQEHLDAETLLIQYHAHDDQLLIWAVTRDSARVVVREQDTTSLTSQVWRCHRTIADQYSTPAEQAQAAGPLAALLLDPVADELAAHRRVVFVPYGGLAVLPLHVLPFAGADLSSTHEVSYLPAASAARPTGARKVGQDARALIVGDPDYGELSTLGALPGARAEAMAIAGLRGTEPLIGPTATRQNVLTALTEADVVHLATHGLFSEGRPGTGREAS
ncbi:MAG: CHAT domain-containing protein [Propioniciclava sp.]|uniref:CHAT domain-containing protein n=1 Tax=Propioniciclava sp. TaxID=2038686 RepID=UPI0039E5F1C9